MKNKIIYIITIVFTLFSISSCDDYLDIAPEGQQNSENYFNNPQDFQDALVGVYDLLATTALNNILGEIASDNSLCGGENPTDVLDWQQIDDMIHTPDNGALRSVWQWMYAGISRANYIVEFQDKIDFEGKEKILAENLFLRSYYYFELVKFFGDVPMYTDGRISIAESQTIDKTPKSEIYSQLESDLLLATENLPWQQNQQGRVTKGAAWALLGKIYLYQNKFDESADALNKVIASGQYQLISDFSTIFKNNNENNIESLLKVGKIHFKVRKEIQKIIKPGLSLKPLANTIESNIVKFTKIRHFYGINFYIIFGLIINFKGIKPTGDIKL